MTRRAARRGAEAPDPVPGQSLQMTDEEIVARALSILESRARHRDCLSSPNAVRDYLRLSLSGRDREAFCVVFLDAQHRVLAIEELFQGTLTQTSVYPREVVKRALHWNCAAVLLAHCHPSGQPEPSAADRLLTQSLQSCLLLVDVKVLDHFVVGDARSVSFAEQGLL